MAEYRVYLVGTDDHFYDAIPMICANDAEAIEHADSWPSVTALSFGSLTERSRYSRTKIRPDELKPFRVLHRLRWMEFRHGRKQRPQRTGAAA